MYRATVRTVCTHLQLGNRKYKVSVNMDFAPSKQEVNEDVEYVLIGAGEKVARC